MLTLTFWIVVAFLLGVLVGLLLDRERYFHEARRRRGGELDLTGVRPFKRGAP